ncbi:MAG TPA: aminotransferase class I/II-fold pyridoxal phosphate-dependent enzyme, partial [Thermoanaerobaculia bacterium]
DAAGRVIYVGSFSKTLFPALRLGFLILPDDLRERLLEARRSADVAPPLLDQLVLADFMAGGHFAHHLRRMRSAYRERLEALSTAARAYCHPALRLRPAQTGLHVLADLDGVDAEAVHREAAARGVEVTPLADYSLVPESAETGLVLGFGASSPAALASGMERLGEAIAAAGGR